MPLEPVPGELVSLKDCIKGRIYRLKCRNLHVGVFDGHDGFIGIREKFGSRYLFTEFHWEQGAPFGTVRGAEDLGIDTPKGMILDTDMGTYCATTGRPLVSCPTDPNPNFPPDREPILMGWWRFADTNEPAPTVDEGTSATSKPNDALFEFLKSIELKVIPERWTEKP